MENATLGANVKFKNKTKMREGEFWDIGKYTIKFLNTHMCLITSWLIQIENPLYVLWLQWAEAMM